MSWKSTARSINAAANRSIREQKKRQRELEKQLKQSEKLAEAQRAAYAVQKFENYIDVLVSMHKECGEAWDWVKISQSSPPSVPVKTFGFEDNAKMMMGRYKPSLFDKLFRRTERKIAELKEEIEIAKRRDEEYSQNKLKEHKTKHQEWAVSVDIANRILAGDLSAYHEAIAEINPVEELGVIGAKFEIKAEEAKHLEVNFDVRGEDIVPTESMSQLKSGKLSVKNMTKTRYYEIYQDYVCSATLRIAREFFALLPVNSILVTASSKLLNTSTGKHEILPILSVYCPRETIDSLNYDFIDPSDSLSNFIHSMKFKKTQGFSFVEQVDISRIDK